MSKPRSTWPATAASRQAADRAFWIGPTAPRRDLAHSQYGFRPPSIVRVPCALIALVLLGAIACAAIGIVRAHGEATALIVEVRR